MIYLKNTLKKLMNKKQDYKKYKPSRKDQRKNERLQFEKTKKQ